VIGTIDLSWTINKELDRYVSLFGTRGAVVVGWKQSRFRRLDAAEWTVIGNGYDKVGAFRAQLVNFARAVRGQEEPLVGPNDILGSVRVVEAAYESLRRNYWTSVDSELPARL
jgi:predicted dehydrogenase